MTMSFVGPLVSTYCELSTCSVIRRHHPNPSLCSLRHQAHPQCHRPIAVPPGKNNSFMQAETRYFAIWRSHTLKNYKNICKTFIVSLILLTPITGKYDRATAEIYRIR